MITSFFKPKSKAGCKRSRTGDEDSHSVEGNIDVSTNKKQHRTKIKTTGGISMNSSSSLSSPRQSSSTTPLSEEAATLLSFLHAHESDHGVDNGPAGEEVSWRKALIQYFATAKFASLAKFVASERWVWI